MGSSWPLVCPTVLLWVLLSSASTGFVEQREVTFDLDQKGMEEALLQKEVDWAEFFDPKGGSRPGPRGHQPNVQPRSFGGLPILNYPVQFPLSRPTLENLQAICLHGNHRPRYPVSYFPASGYGQQRRRAKAVNKAESWFSTCCAGNQTWAREVTLCCATQAWELSVKSFCKEDSSVKDRLYQCCRQRGRELFNCFNNDSPNPNYEPTEEIPVQLLPSTANFTFDPKTCPRTMITPHSVRGKKKMTPSTSQKVDINFPPGRPTADSIESLCRDQALRPRYSVKCLPGTGYELLSRQAKTINRMEKGFKHCCKKKQDFLNCAEQKWSEELNKFCSVKKGGKVDFHCCSGEDANDRLNCFQNISPDPHYNMTSEELSLNRICDTEKIIKKKFPVGFPLKSFVEQCCPLSEQEKTICSLQKLEEVSASLCLLGKASSPAARRCCRKSSQETPDCISKILMDAITKATKVLRQKKKKRCPIS
ncbi:extracellular matrix protein 1 isoform X1 [Paralichthys olivaceus]|uniref:extracellular matrix protein 1 isoform X1 n=1 Tax=Paralichthys olivaceus TaxID=8255 RepID=UPI00097D22D9|nr:PREDICTED: extracellular matrix protein 1-like isoform X2 [Paralichthys olivaceus]